MLSRVEALHTAARRYCIGRAEVWRNRFFERTPGKWNEKFELLRQRYRVLDRITSALEALTPAESASLEETRRLLLAAAANAVAEYLPGDHLPFEREVVQDEARLFAAYLQGISDSDLARVEPLPYRHVLSEAESAHLWAGLNARWGVKRGLVWYPHDRYETEEPPPHTQGFDESPFSDEKVVHQLREVLASLGVSRLWELRAWDEWNRDYEIDLALLDLTLMDIFPFDLDEAYWTDASFEWLIYHSHEDTVTIAGTKLLSGLQAAWPAWRDFLMQS